MGGSVDHDKMKKKSVMYIWVSIFLLMVRAMIVPYLVTTFADEKIESLLILDIINVIGQIMQSLVAINILTFVFELCLRFDCLCQVLR